MGAAIRAHDWSSSPLGWPGAWPSTLRVGLGLMLGSPESMFLAWGPELRFFFNDAYRPILGPRIDAALGRPMAELWSDMWEQFKPTVDRALAGEASRYDDLPFMMARHGEEEQTWWSLSYSPLRDEHGAVVGLFCVASETTERVRSTARLSADEARNRQILDSAIDYAIVAADLDGHVTRWNEGAARVLGWSEAEMLGQPLSRFFTPEDVVGGRVATEMRNALFKGHGNDERWHLRKNGERFWAIGELTVLRDEHRAPIGFVKVLRDRTEQRQAEEALRELNDTLERKVEERTQERDRIWQVSRDMLGVADSDGAWLSINPAWTEILGWSADRIIGRTSEWLEHPDDCGKTRGEIARLAAGRPTLAFQNRFRATDGGYRHLSWTVVPVEGRLYCVARDVSQERAGAAALLQTEEALRQSQKLEAVGQLTGGVAHDFNNLLTVIKSSTDLLKRPNLSEERRHRYVEAISDTVDRAARLTGQLLAFARRQALRPEVFDAARSVCGIGEMIGTLTGARIKVTIDVLEAPCLINADANQFDTALVNMAVNARDSMDGEGLLSIRVDARDTIPRIRSHAAKRGNYVAVSLTDSGKGIPPDEIGRIFEPFFTTKGIGQGTGLGLSQVFGFAKQSGGEIIAESTVGEGATFTLYLPRAVGVAPTARKPDEDLVADGRGTRVLVVEDNHDVGTFSTQTLEELGYATSLAANADEALAALEKSPDAYDVIFTDVVMPGRDGVDLARQIQRLYPKLPVILTSGYSTVLVRDLSHGFELLQKPYSVEALSRILRKAVGKRRRRAPSGTDPATRPK